MLGQLSKLSVISSPSWSALIFATKISTPRDVVSVLNPADVVSLISPATTRVPFAADAIARAYE